MSDNKAKLGGELIVKFDRTHELFKDKPHLRLLREIYALYNLDKTHIGPKHAISLCMDIRAKYLVSVNENAKRLLKMNKDLKEYKVLDAIAYSDKIEILEQHMEKVRGANTKIRMLADQLTKFTKDLANTHDLNTKGHEFAQTLIDVVKLKRALLVIANDKEAMTFIKPDHFDAPEKLALALSEIGIGDITKSLTEMTELLDMSCRTFMSQLHIIKDFIKESSEEEYVKIADLTKADVPTIADVIAFVKDFKKYYISIRENEDFIKLDGVTEELSESINSIISTSSMLNVIGLGKYDAEARKAMEDIAKASIEQNQEKIFVTFFESKKVLDKLFKEDIIDLERRADLHYLLVMGSFLMFELTGGMLAINVIDKLAN